MAVCALLTRILSSFRADISTIALFYHDNGKPHESAGRKATMEATMEVTMEVARLLPFCEQPESRRVLQKKLKLKNADHFRKAYILPAIKDGWIEMTIPGKPQSRLQKYRLTAKGKSWLGKDDHKGE